MAAPLSARLAPLRRLAASLAERAAVALAPAPPRTQALVNPGGRLISFDPNESLWNEPGSITTDAKYRHHKFLTWHGWYHWPDGWSPTRAREAATMHLRGWPYMSQAIARDVPKYPPIFGALKQRMAPCLRASWRIEGPTRAPGRFAVDDLRRVWREFRASYADTLRTNALMGGQWYQVWWELDDAAGVERPRLERWPWEACMWRGAGPTWPGGWYAMTVDSGFVRMVPDGHWIYLSQSERSHEMGAIIALATTFVAGELGRRDEAGLSEAAGRAAPFATLPRGVKVGDEIGVAVQEFVEEFGLSRIGGVVPFETKLEPFQIVSDTDFFKNLTAEQLLYVGLVVLGQVNTLGQGPSGVYQNLGGLTVAESLVDEDLEATTRGWDQLARAYCEINGQEYEDGAGEPLFRLVGERYADRGAKAKATTERATLLANWATAAAQVFDVQQADVDAMAAELSTPPLRLRPVPLPAAPGAVATPPNLAQKDLANAERSDEKAGA